MLPSLILSLAIASIAMTRQHLHRVARQANSTESPGHKEAVRKLREYRTFYAPALEADATYLEGRELRSELVTALEVVFPGAPATLSARCRWKYLWYYFRSANRPGQIGTGRELADIDKQRTVSSMVALLQKYSKKRTPPLFIVQAAARVVVEAGQAIDRSRIHSLRFLSQIAEIEVIGAFAAHGDVQQARQLVRYFALLDDEGELLTVLDLLFESPCAPLLAGVVFETQVDNAKRATVLLWARQRDLDTETLFPREVRLSNLPPRWQNEDGLKRYRRARRQLLKPEHAGSAKR